MTFQPLPEKPDHVALERDMLDRWDADATFERLREKNAGGPWFSFIDGPITANNPMGVHHAWGRTLKDVFQRYHALRGCEQRYQNGFDCQGLWVEVEVEKALGLNSKREIEEYGLAEFTERCKERVAEYSELITDQSRRLGMWMDWDNDYYTHSDTNIEYIWRFLAEVDRRGWLYKGHRSTQWCPRCGTSLSQHEQAGEGNYKELAHPSLFVRFPLLEREGESLVVWTTTPWTLPANVAAAVKPDADYGRRANGEWVAVALHADEEFVERLRGEQLVGWRYHGPFDDLAAQQDVEHRVIPWDDVALDEGTGIVHIAPGAGAEDFELSRVHGLPVLAPVNDSGRFYPAYGWLEGMDTDEAAGPIVDSLRERGLLAAAGEIVHRYPICWRCRTPLIFRVVDDWFISVDEIRQPLLDANQDVAWTPPFYGKRMDDWLRNMGDWNISRKRYYGLPLPFYPCHRCDHLNVIGSRAELEQRATAGLAQLKELHRPWIDEVTIRCEACGEEGVRRIPEVGDAWLDAGIVPMSTLGWQNDTYRLHGYATGAAEGVTGADLPDNAYWEKWFPADWISEMREQIRLWFYSISFMSMTLVGRLPYRAVLAYEKLLDETGREMHRSWGNAILADEALERMGADVMRWLFAAQNPGQNMRFGYGPANEVKRRLLTLWNSASFLVTYANIDGWRPAYGDLSQPPRSEHPLDAWLVARTQQLVREMREAYEAYWTPSLVARFESFVDDLSNWYIRRSRRRFWDGDADALRTLWYALAQSLRVVAPVMPFLADWLWRRLVAERAEGAPDSVHLAGWPDVLDERLDGALLEEIAAVRRVVELGRQARSASGLKLRQPLRRLVVQGGGAAERHAAEIADELRVKEVEFGEVEAVEVRVKPNLPVLGPKLGKELGRAGWAVAEDDGVTVALSTELDDELRLEARALDLIHRVNSLRRESGLELTDRIVLTLPEAEGDLLAHYEETIKRETLAVEIRVAAVGQPAVDRV